MIGLLLTLLASAGARAGDYYTLGAEWTKNPVTPGTLLDGETTPGLRKVALATAKAGGATAFYLGKFQGRHLMATNHHVYPFGCRGDYLSFPHLGNRQVLCLDSYGSWQAADFSIFSIRVPEDLEAELMPRALELGFGLNLTPGQALATVGFGDGHNPGFVMVGDQGRDCVVLSGPNSFRRITDRERENSGPDTVWSFAHGCQSSRGDEGSAIVDRASGVVVGLAWSAAMPKNPKVQDDKFIDMLLGPETDETWTLLNYAVPIEKVREALRATVDGKEEPFASYAVERNFREILKAVLDGKRD